MEKPEAGNVVVSIKVPMLASFIALLLACGLILAVFLVGVSVGKTERQTRTDDRPISVSVTFPEALQLTGIPDGKTECLEWVKENFKDVKSGLLSLICNGRAL